MRIAVKLDVGFENNNAVRRLYGQREVLSCLRELGVAAVETPLGPSSHPETVAEHVRRCQQAGLSVSFHPYTERLPANPACFDGPESGSARVHSLFLSMAAAAVEEQGETAVNIHPAAGASDLPRPLLFERSMRFFTWAGEWCEEHAPDVHPVAELQVAPDPDEPLVRIGDRPDELSAVAHGSGVGVCWDVGHAVMNHRRFGTPLSPPDDLWERIAHVHCHDVDTTDHLPPRDGPAPWRDFLSRLATTGFAGTVVIEVTAEMFLDHGGLSSLAEAVTAVRSAVDQSGAHHLAKSEPGRRI